MHWLPYDHCNKRDHCLALIFQPSDTFCKLLMKHGLETYLPTFQNEWKFKILYGKEQKNEIQDV
jgi:hypothetical protein